MSNWLQNQWKTFTFWHVLLIPLSWLFLIITNVRKYLYQLGWLKSYRLPVPVVIVGNINVGGTGKTPLVIWLAEQLKVAGYRPGIISRGYGGHEVSVQAVLAGSNPQQVGDEPVLIAKRTGCALFVGIDRVAAGKALLKANPECNVIISDDGLQHYRLQRDVEIALVDSSRLFGNQLLLPAGPLREKISRLHSVDAIVDSGNLSDFKVILAVYLKRALQTPIFKMHLQGDAFENLNGIGAAQPANYFSDKNLVAIAGIGNPQRFFNKLAELGLKFESKAFEDHHAFSAKDLEQFSNKTILMTEKDAVKCQAFNMQDAWYLPVSATLSHLANTTLINVILNKLRI